MSVGCPELLLGYKVRIAVPGALATLGVVMRVRIPLGHGYLSVVNVVSFQIEISATDRSLVQRSPTICMCVSLNVIRCNNNPLHLE